MYRGLSRVPVDNETGEIVHQTCSLHLNTQNVLLSKQIPLTAVLDNLVTRADETIMYNGVLGIPANAINKMSNVTTLTGESLHRSVVVGCLKQTILLGPWMFGFVARKLVVSFGYISGNINRAL